MTAQSPTSNPNSVTHKSKFMVQNNITQNYILYGLCCSFFDWVSHTMWTSSLPFCMGACDTEGNVSKCRLCFLSLTMWELVKDGKRGEKDSPENFDSTFHASVAEYEILQICLFIYYGCFEMGVQLWSSAPCGCTTPFNLNFPFLEKIQYVKETCCQQATCNISATNSQY